MKGSLSTAAVTAGTNVTVTCDSAYSLDGDTTLYCQDNGTWDKAVGTCKSGKRSHIRFGVHYIC